MGHDHHDGHHHGPAHQPTNNQAFILGIILNLGFVGVEATYGILAHSLALVADAGHNLSDVLGLGLGLGASFLVRRQPSLRRTYGLRRSSILAALLNAMVLLLAVGAIAWEALQRFSEPQPVVGATVVWVALLGIVINAGSAWLFLAGQKEDLNLRAAFMHLASDALVSLGTAATGLVVLATGWAWLDPLMSLGIAVIILLGTWGLLVEALDLALDAVPRHIQPEDVQSYLATLPGVAEVHDLHIWGMSTTEVALTAHLLMPEGTEDAFLVQVQQQLLHDFGIQHTTLQIETEALSCERCILQR